MISIDTVGPLREQNNYRYILTMQCELTKFTVAHSIPRKDALTIAKTLVEQLIALWLCRFDGMLLCGFVILWHA